MHPLFEYDPEQQSENILSPTIPTPEIPEIVPTSLDRSSIEVSVPVTIDIAYRFLATMTTVTLKDVVVVSATISDLQGAVLRRTEIRGPVFQAATPIDKTVWASIDTADLQPSDYRLSIFVEWAAVAVFGQYVACGGGAIIRIGDQVYWANAYYPTREKPNDRLEVVLYLRVTSGT